MTLEDDQAPIASAVSDKQWQEKSFTGHEEFTKSSKFRESLNRFSYQAIYASGKVENAAVDDEKEKFSAKDWMTLITLAFANFSIGACVSLQAPFFPKEAELKGATPTQYGMIFGVYQLAMFVFSPVCGKLMGKMSPKFILDTGMFVVGAATILFGILDLSPPGLPFIALCFVVRIAEGLGSAAVKTSIYTIISARFKHRLATIFSGLETFLGLGLITGPTLGGALYDLGGFQLPFIAVGVLILVDVVVMFIILPNPDSIPLKGGNLVKFWLNPRTLLYASLVFTTFNCIGYNQSTLEPHLRKFDLSGVIVGSIFIVPGGVYSLTAPVWGRISDHGIDTKLLAVIGCILMSICYLFIGPAPFIPMETTIASVCVSLMFFGFGTGGKLVSAFLGVLNYTITDRGYPADVTTYGLVSSMVASSQSLGAFIGPSLGGYLLETVGYKPGTMVLFAIELLLASIILTAIVHAKCTKHKEKGTDEEKAPLIKNHLTKDLKS